MLLHPSQAGRALLASLERDTCRHVGSEVLGSSSSCLARGVPQLLEPGAALPSVLLVLSLPVVKVSVLLLVLQGRAQGRQLLWPQPGAQPLGATSVGTLLAPRGRCQPPGLEAGPWWVLRGVPRVLGALCPVWILVPALLKPRP